MKPSNLLSPLALAFLCLVAPPAVAGEESPLERIESEIRKQRWESAAEASLALVEDDPENAYGWYYLASAHHQLGDLEEAIRAGKQAIRFGSVRANSLYNLACAHSLLGEVEPAWEWLQEALASGYLDLDHIARDPDLINLRRVHSVDLSASQDYQDFRGRNGVRFQYLLQLPEGHGAGEPLSFAVVFGPGNGGVLATDWNIAEFWAGAPANPEWAVVHLVAPERGWRNHPAHHALEDLFQQLRKDYTVADERRFHLFGYGDGASPAQLYASMSKRYVASLTVAATGLLTGWSERDFRRRRDMPTQVVVSSRDAYQLGLAEEVVAGLREKEGVAILSVVDDSLLLPSRRSGGFLTDLERLREATR